MKFVVSLANTSVCFHRSCERLGTLAHFLVCLIGNYLHLPWTLTDAVCSIPIKGSCGITAHENDVMLCLYHLSAVT